MATREALTQPQGIQERKATMANTELTTVEEVKSMLSYWRERLANAVRPKHIEMAGQRISELQRDLERLSGPTPDPERGEK